MKNNSETTSENDIKPKKQRKGMKHMARAGLGFIGGFLALWGAYAIQSGNQTVGGMGILLGVVLFIYGYKAD